MWLGADERLEDRPVALKRALHDGTQAEANRIKKEAEALAHVHHPNVISVLDVVQDRADDQLLGDGDIGDAWVVMEFVRGGRTLASLGRVTPLEAARYGAQLAGGLAAAHAAGILHRDVKPANVLITDEGFVMLADFGISRVRHSDETLIPEGKFAGTPGYIAPEYVRGGAYTAKSDVFSVGATLYHLLEGTTPFGVGSGDALIAKARDGAAITSPQNAGPLAPILVQMLDHDPARRPTLSTVREKLATLSGDRALGTEAARWTRSQRAAVVGFALVVLAGVGTWLALGLAPGAPPELPTDGGGSAADAEMPSGTTSFTSMIGDEATADPCALLDTDAVAEFGKTRLDPGSDIFNSCHLLVTEPDGAEIEVDVEIYRSDAEPDGEVDMIGSIGVVHDDEDLPESCGRELFLPDDVHIISVEAARERDGQADLCALADATAQHAARVLNAGQIPRRSGQPDLGSLIGLSACDLFDAQTLELLPGVDAQHPAVSYGEWECNWFSTTSDDRLRVLFQRSEPTQDGQWLKLAGHDAVVQRDAWDPDSCLVSVVNRLPVPTGGEDARAELVRVLVFNDDPLEQRCALATRFAEAAAARLPAG
ncbi:protein kinase [Saccharopolyspora sp. K220]|nr:protein kinase [Saccharopolyspora soli]